MRHKPAFHWRSSRPRLLKIVLLSGLALSALLLVAAIGVGYILVQVTDKVSSTLKSFPVERTTELEKFFDVNRIAQAPAQIMGELLVNSLESGEAKTAQKTVACIHAFGGPSMQDLMGIAKSYAADSALKSELTKLEAKLEPTPPPTLLDCLPWENA